MTGARLTRKSLLRANLSNEVRTVQKLYVSKPKPVPRDRDLIFGDMYLVAVHAALESYFEELCRLVVISSLWNYKRNGKISETLDSLLRVHHGTKVGSLPRQQFAFTTTDRAIGDAMDWYIRRIGDNSGIKRSNLYALLLPLGFKESDFDPLWLDNMDSFGGRRGDIAHGRPVSSRRSTSLTLGTSHTGVRVALLPQNQARSRVQYPSWQVDNTLLQLLPEAFNWDVRCLKRF